MKLRGIIFDFDGTLADTWSVYDKAFEKVTQQFLGRHIPFEERIKNKGSDEIDFVRNLIPNSPDDAARLFITAFEEAHQSCVMPRPGVGPLLDGLSFAGLRLGVVSAKAHDSATIAFEKIQIRHYFDPVITGTGWTGGKTPNILTVAAKWGMRPEEVAYIGDSRGDMADALGAGVHPIGVAWEGMTFAVSSAKELHDAGARAVFTAPNQLAQWVSSRI